MLDSMEYYKEINKMKEVTYDDWQKNPIPRMMWVWDNDESEKKKRKVVYVLSGVKGKKYNVLTVADKETCTTAYTHCAEIEEPRRMTKKELSRWIREKTTREYKYKNSSSYIYTYYEYKECHADEEVDDIILIREDDGEWREPLVEDL